MDGKHDGTQPSTPRTHVLEKIGHFDRERVPNWDLVGNTSRSASCPTPSSSPRQRRLQRPGANGDAIDARAWPKSTSSVENRPATAEEVLGGMRRAAVAADLNRAGHRGEVAA